MLNSVGDSVPLPGCSLRSRHLETSTGCASLDGVLGGGLPNTSLLVIDELGSRAYADVLLRLFISEGLHEEQDVLHVSSPLDRAEILEKLPARLRKAEASAEGQERAGKQGGGGGGRDAEEMKIAWRYAPVKQIESSVSRGGGATYDLAQTMESESRKGRLLERYPEKSRGKDGALSYQDLLAHLADLLALPEYSKKSKKEEPKKGEEDVVEKCGGGSQKSRNRLLRVAIRGLGGPLWSSHGEMRGFLARLAHLTRKSYVVIMATCDSSSLSNDDRTALEHSSDAFFRLESMNAEEKKIFDPAHGYFRIVRLPRLSSLAPPAPPAVDLSFDLHRRHFDVKILHLPPALGDDEGEEGDTKKRKGATPCGIAQDF